MIRILNKSLLKERITAQLFKPVADPRHSFSTCRRPFPSLLHHAPSTPQLWSRGSMQCYSTIQEQASVKTKPDVPPPSNSFPKRPKVDLRPAPKRSSREQGSNVKLPRPPSSVPRSKSVSPSAEQVTSGSSPELSRAMKHDIAEATKHGILTPPPEGASRFQRLWHQFVQLFKFYWSGLKLIFVTHRRQATEIRRRAAEARAKDEDSPLSRWETRFLQTYDRDLVKLVPFVLTLIILEEALPLVVLYAPGLLPSTCLLPSQRDRIEAKRRAKQVMNLETARAELSRLGQNAVASSTEHGVKSLSPVLIRSISGAFSRPTWGPFFLLQHRIEKRLAYLTSDDALLVREGFGAQLGEEELIEALEERGIIPDSKSQQHLRDQLEWWLRGARDEKARLALVLRAASGEATKATL